MKLVWTKLALKDLRSAYDYIAEASPSNASKVIERVEIALQNLKKHPEIGRRGRVAGTRELALLTTPFVIPYRVTQGTIEILAFMHGARKWPEEF